jgi:hypothetical protein
MDELEADMDADLEADLAIDDAAETAGAELEDGGEEAAEAMGGLFDAADRLLHNPANVEALVDVDRLATVVAESAPPYGVEVKTWEQVGNLADAVLAASDDEDEGAVAESSRALRDFLRTFV